MKRYQMYIKQQFKKKKRNRDLRKCGFSLDKSISSLHVKITGLLSAVYHIFNPFVS